MAVGAENFQETEQCDKTAKDRVLHEINFFIVDRNQRTKKDD